MSKYLPSVEIDIPVRVIDSYCLNCPKFDVKATKYSSIEQRDEGCALTTFYQLQCEHVDDCRMILEARIGRDL